MWHIPRVIMFRYNNGHFESQIIFNQNNLGALVALLFILFWTISTQSAPLSSNFIDPKNSQMADYKQIYILFFRMNAEKNYVGSKNT